MYDRETQIQYVVGNGMLLVSCLHGIYYKLTVLQISGQQAFFIPYGLMYLPGNVIARIIGALKEDGARYQIKETSLEASSDMSNGTLFQ